MSQKRRPVPGADRIDDLVNAVGEGWKHEVDGIDVRAVGLFTRVFVLSRLESQSLTPSGPADAATLVRRLSFALTGLPPAPENVDDYLADASPDKWERLIDRGNKTGPLAPWQAGRYTGWSFTRRPPAWNSRPFAHG